jgi:hypothetical protein
LPRARRNFAGSSPVAPASRMPAFTGASRRWHAVSARPGPGSAAGSSTPRPPRCVSAPSRPPHARQGPIRNGSSGAVAWIAVVEAGLPASVAQSAKSNGDQCSSNPYRAASTPGPGTAWTAVPGPGVSPRQATFERRLPPANRVTRRRRTGPDEGRESALGDDLLFAHANPEDRSRRLVLLLAVGWGRSAPRAGGGVLAAARCPQRTNRRSPAVTSHGRGSGYRNRGRSRWRRRRSPDWSGSGGTPSRRSSNESSKGPVRTIAQRANALVRPPAGIRSRRATGRRPRRIPQPAFGRRRTYNQIWAVHHVAGFSRWTRAGVRR